MQNRKIYIVLCIFALFVLAAFQSVIAVELPRERTVYIAISGRIKDPTNFNLYAPGVSRSSTGLHQFIYEYFFYINFETGEYIPWLAERYEYSPDFKSITVYLRKGVEWSDGVPFTADDVVFTYNLLINTAPKMIWSSEVAKYVDSVEKIDDYTVKINLKHANPRFHLIREAFPVVRVWGGLTILPKHIWEKVEDPVKFKNNPPIGTGPYRLLSASETTIIYERRDDWWATELWGIRPAPKYVVMQYVGPEESVAAKLEANEIDTPFIGILSLGTFKAVAKRNPDVRAWHKDEPYAWLDPCPRAFMVQNAKYPWSLKEVRRAISYMIDRDAIAEFAYERSTQPSWGVFPYYGGLKPYFDAIQDLIEKYKPTEYNLKKAEEILTGLGFKKGPDGVWVTPNGTRLEMEYLVNGDSAEEMRVATVVADQLRAGGIDVKLKVLTGPVQADTRLRGEWDIVYQCFCPGDSDPYDNLELFHSKFYVPLGERAPWYERNTFRYKNPKYDEVVDELARTPPSDLEKCVELFRKAMEILFEDLPVIPGMQAPALVPFNYHYWENWPSAENPWNMPVSWWATFNLVLNGYLSPKTGEWVGGIKPTKIDYVTVVFSKDTPKFRGIDLTWYGPFKAGETAEIPLDDAEFWIAKGYARRT
ncbi:MAG TPA: ABC transporter substrate-binding protein [Thermofilum sp.]|nr:ABC transporter substrate-binding protein [Thermofilum sp.]